MRAVTVPVPGGPRALIVSEVPEPVAGAHEVVIDVAAARAVADGDGDAAEHQVRTHIAIVSHEVQEAPGSEADRAAD